MTALLLNQSVAAAAMAYDPPAKGPFWVNEVYYVDKENLLSYKERSAITQELKELIRDGALYLPDKQHLLRAACKLLYSKRGLIVKISLLERQEEIYVDLQVTIRKRVPLIATHQFYGQLKKRDRAWLKETFTESLLFPNYTMFLKKRFSSTTQVRVIMIVWWRVK